MFQEFREFIRRGNVIDLAVAVVMGAAFTDIVNSLVDDIIMPFIGVLLGGVDFTSLAFSVGDAQIMYGNFIQAIINFLIIAFVIFLAVRAVNQASAVAFGESEEEEAPPEPSAEEKLLAEIRDLLQKQQA
jgi:large conductance mechanosensitive channel